MSKPLSGAPAPPSLPIQNSGDFTVADQSSRLQVQTVSCKAVLDPGQKILHLWSFPVRCD